MMILDPHGRPAPPSPREVEIRAEEARRPFFGIDRSEPLRLYNERGEVAFETRGSDVRLRGVPMFSRPVVFDARGGAAVDAPAGSGLAAWLPDVSEDE